jgi:large subunit ribosomal protein L10
VPTVAKAQTIDDLASQLTSADLIVLTDYRGLKVSDLQDLRSNLRPIDGEFRIAKNTLTRIAAQRAGIEGLDPMLEGPLALGIAKGDIVAFAKVLADFARTSRMLEIRGGVMDNRFISAKDVESISSMPSKEILQGKLLGLLQTPMNLLAGVLGGPSRSLAYLLRARAHQLGGEAMAAD